MNKEIMRALGFSQAVARIEEGVCTTCNSYPHGFRDEISRREFGISGMCQECQDAVFEDKLDEEKEERRNNEDI